MVYRNAGETEAYDELYAARDEQIDSIITLVNVCLADPTIRQDAALSITFGNIDVNGFMRPLLQSAHNSKVLHPGVGDTYKRILPSDLYDTGEWAVPETTAFENLIVAFMQKSAVYIDADGAIIDDSNNVPIKGTNKKLSEIVNGVADWEAEIENICELIELLQSSSFLNGIGDIDLSPLTHLDTYFAKRHAKEELNAFFVCISDSEIFYRCLPGKLEKTIQDAMAGMTIANIDKDIACADFFYTSIDGGNDFTPYSRDEIHSLVDAFEGIASCLDIKLSDLSTINAEPLSQALLKLGSSKIFNSNTEKSNTQFAAVPYRQGMTCYQEMLVDMLMVDALEDYYFLAASPKDTYHVGETHYSDAKSKMAYSVRESFPAIGATYQGQPVTPASFEIIAGPTVNSWRDCIECLKRPYFTDFIKGTAKFEDLTEDSISVMLHALNDCAMYRDCVPNALYKSLVTDNTVSVDGVDFSAADIYFSYYMQENGAFKVTWNSAKPDFNMPFYEPEIDQLSMLIPLLRDNASKFQNVKLKGEGAIDATLLRAILFDVHDSYVFHEAEAVATHENENTIFRQLINVFLNKSKIYDKSLVGPEGNKVIAETDMSLRDVVLSVAEPAWAPEIENTYELLCTIQNSTHFVDSSGNFDLSGLSDPETFFSDPEAKAELKSLLTYVNGGKLYYRCLPAQMDKAMKDSFSGGSSPLLTSIQTDLSCSDYYHMAYVRSDAKKDIHAYPQGEVNDLVDLFEKVATFNHIDLSDLDSVDTKKLRDAMGIMGRMEIYNQNTVKSMTTFTLDSGRQGMTAHQAMLCDVILVDSLESYYFLAESPKDIANVTASHYSEAKNKMAYSIKNLIPALAGGDRDAAQASYSAKAVPLFTEWESCLATMKANFSDLISGGKSIEDFDGAQMKTLLNSLNNCTFYRDCVPNGLHKSLIGNDSIAISGVDLGKSDVFFSYYMHNGAGEFSSIQYRAENPNFDMPFYAPEIDHIADLYTSLKENKSLFETFDLSTPGIDTTLRGTLTNIHDSYVLHISKTLHRPDATEIYDVGGGHYNFKNLSVFEQFVYKVMNDTTLVKTGYDALRDINYALAHDTNAAEYKMRDRILAISLLDGWVVHGSKPFGEIDSLTTDDKTHAGTDADPYVGLIAAGQKAGIFSGGASMEMSFDAFEDMSPKRIKTLFYAVNDSTLLGDVLPSSVSNLLSKKGLGVTRYSTWGHSIAVAPGQLTFNSDDYAFFKAGSSYKGFSSLEVPVAADPTDGGAHYTIVRSDDTDITNLVKATYDAGVFSLDVQGLNDPFTLTMNSGYGFDGDITAKIDYSNFYVGQEKYREKSIFSIGLMLSSVYKGEGKGYYDFGEGSLNLEDPSSDYTHSTYGLLSLFGDSGFFGEALNADGNYAGSVMETAYTAGPAALFNALKFTITANVNIAIDIGLNHISFPNEATISIGERVGKGSTKASHIIKLQEIFDSLNAEEDKVGAYVREAQWFDHYADAAGTFDLYDSYQRKSLHDNEVSGVDITAANIRSTLHNYIDYAFTQSADAMNAMRKLLDSSRLTYAIDVPNDPADLWNKTGTNVATNFGNEVLASILTELESNKADDVDLALETPNYHLLETSRKYTRIGDTARTVEDEKATLRNDYYASEFALVNPTFLTEVKSALSAMEILNHAPLAGQHEALASAFDAMNVGNASKFTHLFYLASLYDRFLPNNPAYRAALFCIDAPLHDLFHDTVAQAIDFAYINATNHYRIGSDPDTNPVFSFAAIASVIRAAAA